MSLFKRRSRIEAKTPEQLRAMRRAGLVVADTLALSRELATAGTSTGEIDAAAEAAIRGAGAVPSFLGYHGFTGSLCISVNDEVVHGIPGERVLQAGDVLKVDAGCIIEGWHSDSARTVILGSSEEGTADSEDERLSAITRGAMWQGIAAFAQAKHIGEIGEVIEDYVRSQPGKRLGILEDYVGHGIGSAMHMPPDVFNYSTGMKGTKIRPGMALAIEPMLTRGGIETDVLDDDWTVVTSDGSRASQWEHSVARHVGGVWVLSAPDGGASELEPLGVTPVPIGQ